MRAGRERGGGPEVRFPAGGGSALRRTILVNAPDGPGFTSNKDCNGGYGITMPKTAGPAYPPLDSLYAAACLEKAGVPFRLVEPMGQPLSAEGLGLEGDELMGLRTSVPTLRHDLGFARSVKARWPGVTLVLFGPSLLVDGPKALADPSVDGVLVGEPELAFTEMASRADWWAVAGVSRRQNGSTESSPARAFVEDLDALPFPNWSLLAYRQLGWDNELFPGTWFLTMLSSRGCPYSCHYCAYPIGQGRRVRARTARNVVEELAHVRQRYGARHVLFRDPLFTLDRERVMDICCGIRSRGLDVSWRCETRPELVDEDLVCEMAAAGCVGINFGVESLSPEVLRAVDRRPCDRERIAGVVRACRKFRVAPALFLVLGLPGETRESFSELVDFVCGLRPYYAQILLASPYEGTPLHDWALERGFLERPVEDVEFFGFEAFMRNEYMSCVELETLRERLQPRLLRSCEATGTRRRRAWRRLRQEMGRIGLRLRA